MSEASITAVKSPESQVYRLPRTVVPEKYDIKLEPDLVNFTFQGEETVHVTIAEPVREITLNAIELEIDSVFITNNQGARHTAQVKFDEATERCSFIFPEEIKAGSWKISMAFKGVLNDKLHGFYRSTYKDANGATKVIACTQMEPADARRAFPCWDEPDFKAVFKVTLIVDRFLTAISNAQVKKEQVVANGQKRAVFFKDTIKMSTYLVAFIIGEFECTDIKTVDDTPVRIWVRPGQLPMAKFAEGIAAHSLAYFNNYYGLKYPGDKLELIAIPDFAFGAMENLGAVTFRDTALLVDEKTASHSELERVADVVAHEIAHMWFGDLATMKWWNGIWLNEAFATFMEMLAVDSWKTNWRRWESFGVARALAMATDGLTSTRTIEFPVHRPEEAQGMFDVLTYQKGASVLRMLEQFLGADNFRRGISLYLAKHKYANTETTDLWDAIEESTHQPVRQMMDTWIYQEGHPLISVELAGDKKTIQLTQQRFLYNAGSSETLFNVPVMLKARTKGASPESMQPVKLLMTGKTATVEMPTEVDYVVVNEGGHGFYRTRYSKELLDRLSVNLNQLAPLERFTLVNDIWASVVAGLQPLSDYLELIKLFKNDRDKNVWTVIIGSLHYIDRALGKVGEKQTPPQLQKLTNDLLFKLHESLGWEAQSSDDELTRQLRGMVIGALGTLGENAEVQKQATELWAVYKNDRSSVDTDIAPFIVSIISHTGDEARYVELVEEFRSAKTPQDRDRYMYSLSMFRDSALLVKTLKMTLNGEVRTQDAPYLVRQVMLNSQSRDTSWQFVTENWDDITRTFPSVSITRMAEGVTGLIDPKFVDETREFFRTHELKQGHKTLSQHLEKLAVAVEFQKREAAALKSL